MSARIGFRAANPLIYRIYNIVLAITLLVVLSPVLLAVALVLVATQGFDIFYRGARVGLDGRSFQIIKFRTLDPARARLVTAGCTLPADANIETPLGRILRETRLDEIPQLLNIIAGDMNICGPRPVRAEIAAIERQRIPNYEMRFEVRPGLIGPTQAYFGHSASKRLRARMNNQAVRQDVSYLAELALLARIGASILERLFGKVGRKVAKIAALDPAPKKSIWVEDAETGGRSYVDEIGLKDVALGEAAQTDRVHSLGVELADGSVRRARVRLERTGTPGLYGYKPLDEVSAFVVERYALSRVVVPARLARVPAMAPANQPDPVAAEAQRA